MNPLDRLRDARGQALPILAISLSTLLVVVGLTIDGGNAFQNQRQTQNGSDAAALAGAVKLADYAACGVWSCTPPSDASVKSAVDAAVAANGITLAPPHGAYYTDVCGAALTTAGLKARADLTNAAWVGNGIIPPDLGHTANCATGDPGPTRGVLIQGHKSVGTFLVGMVGINTWEIQTISTAVSTYGACASSQGCGFLPIAFPIDITSCDGSGKAVDSGSPWLLETFYIFPLCKKDPGNVGWLDLNGQGHAGLPEQILHPGNSPIVSPSWQAVGLSGNTNAGPIQSALDTLDGKTVRALQYDHTCPHNTATDSRIPQINTGPNFGCSSGIDNANGSGISYRLNAVGFTLCSPTMAGCPLPHGAYIQGSNSVCNTGNGSTGCIVGKFVDLSLVPGAGVGGSNGVSPVQLIR